MINILFLKNQLFKDFSYVYSLTILQRFCGLLATYFLVRYLSETQFAEYNLIIGYVSLLTALSLPGLGNAVMQATARGDMLFYRQAQKIMFLVSILCALVFVVIGYVHQLNPEYSTAMSVSLFVCAAFYPLYCGLTIWRNLRSGQKKFKELSILTGLSSILSNVIIVFTIVFLQVPDYTYLIVFYLFFPAALNCIMTYVDFRHKPALEDNISQDGMLSYGVKTSLFSAIHALALRIDSFVVFYFISPEAMAIFTVANKIPEMLRGVTQSIAAILAPRFAKTQKITAKINSSILLYGSLFSMGTIFLVLTIYPYVMNFLFTDKYSEAVLYSSVLLVSLSIGAFSNLYFRFIRSQKDEKNYRNIILIISGFKIAASLVLIPILGVWGAVLSLIIYRLSFLFSSLFVIKKHYSN